MDMSLPTIQPYLHSIEVRQADLARSIRLAGRLFDFRYRMRDRADPTAAGAAYPLRKVRVYPDAMTALCDLTDVACRQRLESQRLPYPAAHDEVTGQASVQMMRARQDDRAEGNKASQGLKQPLFLCYVIRLVGDDPTDPFPRPTHSLTSSMS